MESMSSEWGFFTVLPCFAVVYSIKSRRNVSVDPCHFPSWDDPFARILKLLFSIPCQGSKALPWLCSYVSTKIYWSFLTTQSQSQLGGGGLHCREVSVGCAAIYHCVFPAFLVVSQFCTLSGAFHPWSRAGAPLSGRKPTLFLLIRLFDMKPETGFAGPHLTGGDGSKTRRNQKAQTWCTGVSWLYLSMESAAHKPEDTDI